MSDFDLLLRLRAIREGRAMLQAGRLHVGRQPHARILTLLAMSGEDATVHLALEGPVGGLHDAFCIPDPRVREDQERLYCWLADRMERYFSACRAARTFPQIWVSSAPSAGHIDMLADRLRYAAPDPRVRRLGELLSYLEIRYPIAGQQAFCAATDVLSAHWATGQQTQEDKHLGALLTWIDPPAGMDVFAAVAAAETTPMGFKTNPNFDRKLLLPAIEAYHKERKGAGRPDVLAQLSGRVRQVLQPVGETIHRATGRAIDLLQNSGLRRLPDLDALERLEAEAFEDFMQSRDAGYPISRHDRPKAAAFKFAEREIAQENVEAALLGQDPIMQARAVSEGRVVVGRVVRPTRGRPYRFDLVTDQRILRIRPRDEWYWAKDTRLQLRVETIHRASGRACISLIVTAGSRSVGLPPEGTKAVLVPSTPDWDRLRRTRGHLSTRLQQVPWTHQSGAIPRAGVHEPFPQRPVDPLQALEDLK